ncbi:MAG: DUF6017 domain-containing protein [Anaerostipes sp.]|nr:DUF6017 domain-containing protein [Anaerostipes sp.]
MQTIQFNYFRGMEAEQYNFYRVPKILFTGECFKSLSCEAKVLYGLMLDRMSLSIKNRWFDEEDRPYIYFTVDEIMELMSCKSQKATKLIKELDSKDGIGLIEKKRLGLGKPNVIYVKNFMVKEVSDAEMEEKESEKPVDTQSFENQKSRVSEIENQEFAESKIKNFENQKSGVSEIKNQEFPESKVKNFENQKSGVLKIESQEFRKSKCNNTDINKTELSDTENSETDNSDTEMSETNPIISNPILSNPISQDKEIKRDVMDEMDAYRDIIHENIEYNCFADDRFHKRDTVDELVELMLDVMMMPDQGMIRIAGVDKPVPIVKNRFLKLNYMHIEYVLGCLERNTKKVGNIKQYLLTTLYNAPLTMDNYYQAEVNHDMYGGGRL